MELLQPVISIIVPSFNQGIFLEETLLSIIHQDYDNLELIVIDGGSMDDSVEIIKKYERHIAYWVSEKDRGQSHAINKGLEKATGEWVAWMNSDDCYLPEALKEVFLQNNTDKFDFIYGRAKWGKDIADANARHYGPPGKKDTNNLLKFFYSSRYAIPSQTVFVRRSVLQYTGILDESLHFCMDIDWYERIIQHTNAILFVPKFISFYRVHDQAKTSKDYLKAQLEGLVVAEKNLAALPEKKQQELKALIRYGIPFIHYVASDNIKLLFLVKHGIRHFQTARKDPRFAAHFKKALKKSARFS